MILTNRDIDKWHALVVMEQGKRSYKIWLICYRSTMKTVYWRVTDSELRYLSYVDWASGLYYPMLRKFFDTFFEGTFPTTGKDVYRRHYADIRRRVGSPVHIFGACRARRGFSTIQRCDCFCSAQPQKESSANAECGTSFRVRDYVGLDWYCSNSPYYLLNVTYCTESSNTKLFVLSGIGLYLS